MVASPETVDHLGGGSGSGWKWQQAPVPREGLPDQAARAWPEEGEPIYRAFAFDRDEGPNAEISTASWTGMMMAGSSLTLKPAWSLPESSLQQGVNDIFTVRFFWNSITLMRGRKLFSYSYICFKQKQKSVDQKVQPYNNERLLSVAVTLLNNEAIFFACVLTPNLPISSTQPAPSFTHSHFL